MAGGTEGLWPPPAVSATNAVVVAVLVVLVSAPPRLDVLSSRDQTQVKTRLPLAYQILVFQVAIILLSALIGAAASVWHERQDLDRQYEQRALVIAESVASND